MRAAASEHFPEVVMGWRAAIGIAALALVLSPKDARPQGTTTPFAELRASGVLRPGDKVDVTVRGGQRTTGRLLNLSEAALILTVGRDTRDFSSMNVGKIERRDSIENGIWIGLAIGVGATAVACKIDPDPEHCPYIVGYFGLPAIAASTILGAIVDASIRRTLYLAPIGDKASHFRLFPVLSNARRGVMVSLEF
jgi:hypothetical protein